MSLGSKDLSTYQIVRSRSAVLAVSTGYARFYGNLVADLDTRDIGPNLGDYARTLMAQHNRAVEHEVSNATTLPVVDIRTANTSLTDLDDNIVWPIDLWFGYVAQLHVLDGTEDETWV